MTVNIGLKKMYSDSKSTKLLMGHAPTPSINMTVVLALDQGILQDFSIQGRFKPIYIVFALRFTFPKKNYFMP